MPRLLLGFALGIFLIVCRNGFSDAVQCFDMGEPESPENLPLENSVPRIQSEPNVWCYLSSVYLNEENILAFHLKDGQIQPELTALSHIQNGQVVEVIHGSLSRGEFSLHRSQVPEVNPLPVPLVPQLATFKGHPVAFQMSTSLLSAAQKILVDWQSAKLTPIRIFIAEGKSEASLDPMLFPKDGYWWPYDTQDMFAGAYAPLAKYDSVVQAWTGTSPNSVDWESKNHSLNVEWGGHCNGWAASSVLHREISAPLWEPVSKKVILPSDIKGMFSEASFCVDLAAYGKRYYKKGDDLEDIAPDKFHKVLLYYIDNVKKPIALDRYADDQVDNSVVTGYKLTIKQTKENEYSVVAALQMHYYNEFRGEKNGVARIQTTSYSYKLKTDEQGNIVGGKWSSPSHHPDFLWIPLAERKCGRENPNVDHDLIEKMIDTLPAAKTISKPLTFSITKSLKGDEEIEIPIGDLRGLSFLPKVSANTFDSDVKIKATGYSMYPQKGSEGVVEAIFEVGEWIPFYDLRSLKLINVGSKATPEREFALGSIEYLAGD